MFVYQACRWVRDTMCHLLTPLSHALVTKGSCVRHYRGDDVLSLTLSGAFMMVCVFRERECEYIFLFRYVDTTFIQRVWKVTQALTVCTLSLSLFLIIH